MVAVIAQTCRL